MKEADMRAINEEIVFDTLSAKDAETLHYGGYGAGTPKGEDYASLVEQQGNVWTSQGWRRADTGKYYTEPAVNGMNGQKVTVRWSDNGPDNGPGEKNWLLPLAVGFGALYGIARTRHKSKRKKI
tara:strand:- start:250 stop:621 length:372 start_codon:yes stop_codon:yes gene_type:complete